MGYLGFVLGAAVIVIVIALLSKVVIGVLKTLYKYPTRVPIVIHILLAIVLLFVPYIIILQIWTDKAYGKVTNDVISNPCDETVTEFLLYIEKDIIANKPEVWNGLREIWNIINHSPNVSTELKHKTLATLRTKGMFIGSSKVIDNYKGR